MLLLVTTLSLTITSCGSDDKDDPTPDDISTVGQLNTVTAQAQEKITIDVGCTIYLYNDTHLYVDGGRMIYAGDFQNLTSITTAPVLDSESWRGGFNYLYDEGCYIVHSNTGKFIRMKVSLNPDGTCTFKFQTYVPTNL